MLVSPTWLRANLSEVVLLDASLPSPSNKIDPHLGFERARIPGAVFFDIATIAAPDTPLPRMLPTQADFGRAAGALGLIPSHRVVIYDQLGVFSAPRAWWMLQAMGHEGEVCVLDGGLPAWRNAGFPTEAGPRALPPRTDYDASLRPERVRSLDQMLRHLESQDAFILDARGQGRFEGTTPEPRQGLRGGHIPGSVNLPHGELLGEDGRFLGPEALRALFEARGVGPETQVITTCGSGVTAAKLLFGLELAGFGPGALYDGSWTEWGGRHDTPITLSRS